MLAQDTYELTPPSFDVLELSFPINPTTESTIEALYRLCRFLERSRYAKPTIQVLVNARLPYAELFMRNLLDTYYNKALPMLMMGSEMDRGLRDDSGCIRIAGFTLYFTLTDVLVGDTLLEFVGVPVRAIVSEAKSEDAPTSRAPNAHTLFLDCESIGLSGRTFSAALIDIKGATLFNGYWLPASIEDDPWLRDNVLPHLSGIEYLTEREFLQAFSTVWLIQLDQARQHGASLAVVTHLGVPVEANFFRQLQASAMVDVLQCPYPFLDTAPLLMLAGYDPTSEEAYAAAEGIALPDGYQAHTALADAQLTRLVWLDLINRKLKR